LHFLAVSIALAKLVLGQLRDEDRAGPAMSASGRR